MKILITLLAGWLAFFGVQAQNCDDISLFIAVETENWADEIDFEIVSETGEVVFTFSEAMTMPAADFSNYTFEVCLTAGCHEVFMYDSFGDGWNGATVTMVTANSFAQFFELPSGSFGQGILSINTDCSQFQPPVFGCTDPEAFNYNPEATEDDGSCITTTVPNDLCEDAMPIEPGVITIDNTYAVNNVGIWGECWNSGSGEGEQNSVWYSFTTPDEPASIFLQTFGDGTNTLFDTQFGLFTECGDEMIACDGNGGPGLFSAFFFGCGELEPNTTYILMIDGWFGNSGTCLLTYEVNVCGPQEGCTDPEALNYDPNAVIDDNSCTYPIDCEGLTTVMATMVTDIFGFEISWQLTDENQQVVMSGNDYGNNQTEITETCLEDGCYYLTMFDSFGDGWNGALLTFTLSDGSVYSFELPNGSFGQGVISINSDCGEVTTPVAGCTDPLAINFNPFANEDDGSCDYFIDCGDLATVSITLTTSAWAGEISWIMLDEDGNAVLEGNGYANDSIYYAGACLDDGCYTLEMFDSFGDGWNGAVLLLQVNDETPSEVEFLSGNTQLFTFGVNTSCETAPDPIEGCTDPAAANYNSEATSDDGSCIYPVNCEEANEVVVIFDAQLWGNEVSWNVVDENGNTVLVGSNYSNNTAVTELACLSDGCYTLEMFDSFGDGWNGGLLSILLDGELVLFATLDTGSYGEVSFALNASCGEDNDNPGDDESDGFDGPMNALETYIDPEIVLFPLPGFGDITVDITNLNINENLVVNVYDITGRSIEVKDFGKEISRMRIVYDTSIWPSGVYFVEVLNGEYRKVVRMIRG